MNRFPWRTAEVLSVQPAAEDMMSIKLTAYGIEPHRAGQHYEIRLPGHHLSRKYSVVSAPASAPYLEFGVQLVPWGEISPRLWSLRPGDALELRGPLGSFVWDRATPGPLVLIGAGSGVTPLLSIYQHSRDHLPKSDVAFVVSAKHPGRVMHYGRFSDGLITRFTADAGRLDRAFLEKAIGCLLGSRDVRCFVCGPIAFGQFAVDLLVELGLSERRIRTEMFV